MKESDFHHYIQVFRKYTNVISEQFEADFSLAKMPSDLYLNCSVLYIIVVKFQIKIPSK